MTKHLIQVTSMHAFEYTAGIWNVETSFDDACDSKRLVNICAGTSEAASAAAARNTVVFKHHLECDEIDEAKTYKEGV
jgi:hypothetical protein